MQVLGNVSLRDAVWLRRSPVGLAVLFACVVVPAFGLFPAAAQAAGMDSCSAGGIKLDPSLRLEPVESGETPIFIFGEKISGQTDDLMEATGNAEFRKLGMFIKGDSIRHDLVKDEITAQGQVKLFREGEFYEGRHLRLQLGTTQGEFEDVRYELSSNNGRGQAIRADFVQPMETKLTQATFTTCPRDRPAWELRMSELVVDQIREVGQAQSAYLYWGRHQILPLGNASFPLSDRRKTGFLAPSYATTSRLGLEVQAPFYWNMAPNHDLTLYPRLISRRGVQLGSEYRFLTESSLGTLAYEVLPDDRVEGKTRQFGGIQAATRLMPNLVMGFDAQRVSDDRYFSDFGRSLLGASQRTLPATFSLTGMQNGWMSRLQMQEYQLLQDEKAPLIAPYSWLPRLSVSKNHRAFLGERKSPVDWDFLAEATSFRHPTLAQGERFVMAGSVAYRHFQKGLFLTPKLSLHATHYANSQDGDTTTTLNRYGFSSGSSPADSLGIYQYNVENTKSYKRVLPTFSLEASSIFDRQTSWGDLALDQTLEPKVVYIRTPYQNQSAYPVFDTGSPSLNFAQIFSDAAFNGHDRIADLNQITVGVSTRFIESSTGIERLRAGIGQRYYYADQKVTLPGSTVRTDRESDILAQVSAQLSKAWSLDLQAQYTGATTTWQNGSVVTRYNPKAGMAASAAYRFVRDSSHSIDLAFQWPLLRHWYAVGRYHYSFKNLGGDVENQRSGPIETLAGIEYDGGCWAARVVAQQFVTGEKQKNTAVFLQLELNGVARVGTNPLEALTRSIPNYQAVNQLTPIPPKFDNFQ